MIPVSDGGRFTVIAVLVAAYFARIPLGPTRAAVVSAAIVLMIVFRRTPVSRPLFSVALAVMLGLAGARVAVALVASPVGWTARYYANDHWSGTPEWSSDFRRSGATRVDSGIAFKDDTFPAHYLNDYTFDRGIRREVSEPMSVEWTGYVVLDRPRTERLVLKARGDADVSVDGRNVLAVSSAKKPRTAEQIVELAAGARALVVRYVKPADTDGLIEFAAPLAVMPVPRDRPPPAAWVQQAAIAIDAALLMVFACVAVQAARTSWHRSGEGWFANRPSSRSQAVALALFAIFGVQGWWQASRFAGRVVSLTSGDDWWGFESRARDILHHGPLMLLGQPLGHADPYFYHPMYCYFLAAVHGVVGESLFGPVFVQFLILAGVALIVWRLAAEWFGERPALAGLAVLVLVFELDFVRYYTVTLLSENLYFLTVTLTIAPFVRWVRDGARADLWRTGLWGGISTLTRPPMLLYLVPALILIALVAAKRTRRLEVAATAVLATATVWLLVVAPVTLRNWVAAGRAILVSDVPGSSLISYNMPPSVSAASYAGYFKGTTSSGFKVFAQIAWDHPIAMLGVQMRKIGFSLGLTQLAGGYRPHPELVAITVLYLSMCVASRRMRHLTMWPVHLFVLAHLAGMPLTLPWNYGYRMILAPYVYTSALATAALYAMVGERRVHRVFRTSESRV